MIHSDERLTTPLIRKNGELVECSWDEAIGYVGNKLRDIKMEFGQILLLV